MRRCDPVTVVTAPHIPDLIALAETLRGMSGEPDSRPWPGERRSYPLKSNTEGKRMAAPETSLRADPEARDAPEHMADLGVVLLSPYALARIGLEKLAGRVRVRITTEARPDAPDDAAPFHPSRPLVMRADRIPTMVHRLQSAYDTAIREGMTRKGGIA